MALYVKKKATWCAPNHTFSQESFSQESFGPPV